MDQLSLSKFMLPDFTKRSGRGSGKKGQARRGESLCSELPSIEW